MSPLLQSVSFVLLFFFPQNLVIEAMETATGTVFYLDREPYKNEKPYFCCLPPETLHGNPPTNYAHVSTPTSL